MKKIANKILKIKKSFLKQFVNLWNQEYKVLTSSGFKMNLKKAEKGFKERMFDYYGAFVNKNKLIGFILLKRDKNNLWIKHFVVDKKYRKQGIGKKLLKKTISVAKRKNLILKTEVLKDNNQAYLFFTKNRFQEIFFDKKNNQYILQLCTNYI